MPKLKPESQKLLVENQQVWLAHDRITRGTFWSRLRYRGFTSGAFLYMRKLVARRFCRVSLLEDGRHTKKKKKLCANWFIFQTPKSGLELVCFKTCELNHELKLK